MNHTAGYWISSIESCLFGKESTVLAAHHDRLFSETTRCARQQWGALLLCLLLSLVGYHLYHQGSWVAPPTSVGSMKLFFIDLLLPPIPSNSLFITTPWLLLTQATLQHRTISLSRLIKRSVRLFSKLAAVQLITALLLKIAGLISITFTAIIWTLLLGESTRTMTVSPGMNSTEFLLQMSNPCLWRFGTLLLPSLLMWYLHCRLLFTNYLVITKPHASLLKMLRLSWQQSRSCLMHLLVATLPLMLLSMMPSWGLQISSRTNPWMTIGFTLYSSALGLLASLYFFVLYQQQRALPGQPLYLSKR